MGRVGAQTRKSRGSITPSIKSVSEIGAEHMDKRRVHPFLHKVSSPY